MAKEKVAPVVIEDDGIDLEDLTIDGAEEILDDTEAELTAPAPKAPAKAKKEEKADKPKRQPPTGSTLASVQPLNEGEVGAAYIAELCGVEAKDIRAFLRANYRDMDTTKGQRYRFPVGDPMIQEIADAFKASQKQKIAAKAAPAPAPTPAPKAVAPAAPAPAAKRKI